VDAPVVLAIDGNSLVHRAFHAHAGTNTYTRGRPSWAVRGLLMQLVSAVDRIRPAAVVVGFDDPHASERRTAWPQYKANRVDKLDTLVDQLADAVEVIRALGLHVVVPPGLEADDVLASTASTAAAAGARTVVVTSDRDAFALIDDTTSVLRIINGGVDASPLMTPERLVLLLGVRPEQYRDFAALRGDPSDNLPGVRGVGPRTAAQLLTEFGTAAAAFDDLAAVAGRIGKGVARKLAAEGARDAHALNCQVMALRHDLDVGLDLHAGLDPHAGPGRLPVDPGPVGEVYREHNLTWTLRDALHVLAGVEPDAPLPPRTQVWNDEPQGWRGPRRPAPLQRPEPKDAQLSLF